MTARLPIRFLAALALTAASIAVQTAAQTAVRTSAAVAVDVHVLKITSSASDFIPKVEIVESRRLATGGESGESFHVNVGGTRFGVEVKPTGADRFNVEREIGRSSYSGSATTTLDVSDPWRWGRRPRHGTTVRGALLCEQVTDSQSLFVPLDVKGFMRKAVDVLLPTVSVELRERTIEIPNVTLPHVIHLEQMDDWLGPPAMAARVLGSVPLREYLDPDQVDRILAKGAKIPSDVGDRFWPLLRPLVVLAHRPALEGLAARTAGFDEESGEGPGVRPPSVPRAIEDSILIAYESAKDPAIRGLAGWVATGMRWTVVYDRLIDDVNAGRAVLPGTAAHREALASHLVHARAWQSTTAPLLTLAAGALAIALSMMLIRLGIRRLL